MAVRRHANTNRNRIDRVSEVLTDPRRRRVLRALANLSGDEVTFDDVVDEVAAREPTDRDRVANDLHHIHLPKLADLGVVTYDAEGRKISHQRCRVVDVLALAGGALEDR